LITITEIAEEYGVSRATVHNYRRSGTFPRPAPVEGTEKTKLRFRADEVSAWFEANPKQQGRRTDLATKQPEQGEPVITTTDPDVDTLTKAVKVALESLRGGYHHLPPLTEGAVAEAVIAAVAPVIAEQRASAIDEVVAALTDRAGELSDLADEEMRPSLEERAQEWHYAAEAARKLKGARDE
jgi:predicted DNA-binding transcriptional regulator AlpA